MSHNAYDSNHRRADIARNAALDKLFPVIPSTIKSGYGRPVPIRFERCSKRDGWTSEIDPGQYFQIRDWCTRTFVHGEWYTGIYFIWLASQEQVTMFALRWS
jgi:hypothetical protein